VKRGNRGKDSMEGTAERARSEDSRDCTKATRSEALTGFLLLVRPELLVIVIVRFITFPTPIDWFAKYNA
jgi:hypothetical protein